MEQKFKIRDAAKDMNISTGELIEILKSYTDVEKKATASINMEEYNIILESVSQANQVENFNAFFATRKKESSIIPAEKPAKVEKPKKAEKAEIIADKSADNSVKAEKPAKAEKMEEKKTPKPTAVETAPKPKGAQISKFDKAIQKKQELISQKNEPKPVASEPKPQPQRPQEAEPQKDTIKKEKHKITPKHTIKAEVDVNTIKVNEPPKSKAKGETVQRGEQVTKRVDTRGTYVELDKYNERYEAIGSQTASGSRFKNDNFNKKQKINQRSQQGRRGAFNKQFETEAQKLKRLELERARKQQLKVLIPDEIVVSELAARLKVTASEVIKRLFKLGLMVSINEVVDFDAASLVAEELGAKVEREVIVTIEERLFEEVEDTDENLETRPPVVVVMGHVDHGKTSLLDRIRNESVVEGEAGGITQHIGAYSVKVGGKSITFLDTPGHEAFTAMRQRGASVTDIAILVVAADDGIMPQTVEAINHAKAAGVQIIVAINKIDKEAANPERVKQELTEHELVVEEWGGETICVPVSAKKGIGIEELLEMVNLTAEMMELKANPNRLAVGTVIEAKLDKGRGPIATVLINKGTLRTGNVIIAGTSVGHVRVMRDDKGRVIKEAGPSVPVEIMGLSEVPQAGDNFAVVEDEKLARELVEKRRHEAKEEQFNLYKKVTLDNLFDHIEDGTMKELKLIVKADVQGSVEAVKTSLEKLSNSEVRVKVIHGGVGAISESDVMLADASNAIIIGFNVRPNPAALENATRENVDLRTYSVIYSAIEEIGTAMKGLLAPKYKDVEMGKAEVRNVFKITGSGVVAGCYVLDGKITRQCNIRIVRDGIVLYTDKVNSIRRFKDDVKEIAHGYECGISLDNYSDLKEGDIFEAFLVEEYQD